MHCRTRIYTYTRTTQSLPRLALPFSYRICIPTTCSYKSAPPKRNQTKKTHLPTSLAKSRNAYTNQNQISRALTQSNAQNGGTKPRKPGRRKRTILRPPAALRRRPCDILRRDLDVAQLAVDAVLRAVNLSSNSCDGEVEGRHLRIDDELLPAPALAFLGVGVCGLRVR